MAKSKTRLSQAKPIGLTVLILLGIVILLSLMLHGKDLTLLNPKGQIAHEQFRLIIFTAVVLMTIGIPTLLILYFFAWKYRESNQSTQHNPQARPGKLFVITLWLIPTIFIAVIARNMWFATHRLEPRRTIAANVNPVKIQVIALRWKWLFIYPEQNIATVNFVQVPINTPVEFELTADEAPMNSFWIPHLGGQLYAMTGHVNRLNLMADSIGDYSGRAAEINGPGFAGMKFTARASTKQDFDQWVGTVKQSSKHLDFKTYQSLLQPSENSLVNYYSAADTGIYDSVVLKYGGSHNHTGY